jgi:hypothetical protein
VEEDPGTDENSAAMRPQSGLRRLYRAATATRRRLVIGVTVVLVLIGVVVGVVVSQGGGGETEHARTALFTEIGLGDFAKSRGRPVYWVGPEPGVDYQITIAPDGKLFLVYLPAGSQTGPGKTYLSVGTYPSANAYASTAGLAGRNGFVALKTSGGIAAVYSPTRPTNIFVAYPGVPYQIELFDPDVDRARKLVTTGQVIPVP